MKFNKTQIQDRDLIKKYLDTFQIQDMFHTEIASKANLFTFPKHSYIISAGEPSDFLYILVAGEAKVYSYTNGDRLLYHNYLKPPQLIGEGYSLFSRAPVTSVEAGTTCECIGFSLEKYRSTFLEDNRFLRNVCFTLINRGDHNFSNSLLDPLEVRLASFILNYQNDGLFAFNISQCSQLLNVSYRHLYRIMKLLCEKKILKKGIGVYQIIDADYIGRLSQGIQNLK